MSRICFASRLLCSLRPRAMSTLAQRPRPIETAIDEETSPGYNAANFYPARPGQILNDKYQIITKLGWGGSSTVWLAEDVQEAGRKAPTNDAPLRYVAIKIGTWNFGGVKNELELSHRITSADTSHPGASFLRTIVDDFFVEGPQGAHVCLVYHPMRETLYDLMRRFKGNKLPPQLLKLYLGLLLQALDYLHQDCNLIHTDLKPDNILIHFENQSVLENFVENHRHSPQPHHVGQDGHVTYLSQNNFGPLTELLLLPAISDLDLAVPGGLLPQPAQTHRYRAPEVILGTGWSYSADIWNLGTMIWTLMEDDDLFANLHDERGYYNAHAHLAQMISLLGPPPVALIERDRRTRQKKWKPQFRNPHGELCDNASQFFGGPFFDDDGAFIRMDLILPETTLADRVSLYQGKEKELFLDLVGKMLRWYPKERSTARELLDHPFLVMEDEFYESYNIASPRYQKGNV